jgi:circadian clock protein KaiC
VAGQVRQAISVVKKRAGRHEKTVRELRIQPPGVVVGRQLIEFTGVLTGQLLYLGKESPNGGNPESGGPHG